MLCKCSNRNLVVELSPIDKQREHGAESKLYDSNTGRIIAMDQWLCCSYNVRQLLSGCRLDKGTVGSRSKQNRSILDRFFSRD